MKMTNRHDAEERKKDEIAQILFPLVLLAFFGVMAVQILSHPDKGQLPHAHARSLKGAPFLLLPRLVKGSLAGHSDTRRERAD
jgi:hypothetical protein